MKKLSIFEYDEKAQRRFLREEGRLQGLAEGIFMLLEDLGEVPEGLRKRILEEENFDILKQVNRLTAHAENLEEFSQNYDDMMMRL